MQKFTREAEIVDRVIEQVGKQIVLGAPLGVGKPNHIINAFFQKALQDSSIDLTICTALTLQRPMGASDLERRFMGPLQECVFGDYPDLDYELARCSNSLPENIKVIEFYFPPGKFLNNPLAQQNYISSNYTHVVRDMLDRKINVLAQLVSKDERNGSCSFSLSSNPDVTIDMVKGLESCDYPFVTLAQVNQNLPYMFGESEVDEDFFDFVLDDEQKYFTVFGPPKMSVTDADFMIGLYCSALVKDDGELQIGIGSLGDSTVYSLIQRQENNETYRALIDELQVMEKFGDDILALGGLEPFEKGLFGATEMVVDGFMHMYNAGIIKKKVYDHYGLQRLLNESLIEEDFSSNILEVLRDKGIINDVINRKDFEFLQHWGILRSDLNFREGMICMDHHEAIFPSLSDAQNHQALKDHCLGSSLKNGQLIHGGFFLGPQNFYQWLRDLPEAEKRLINMKSVQKINQLYGHERLDRLHRKNARFVNSCMMHTLSGAAVSDGLEDGRVVSGVGGQYNFVAMAQELPDGNSILNLRATRMSKGKVVSSIVTKYGHITIPRHLRDIVVTEYGIAFLRGKTDEEIIIAQLKITDSRFQDELMAYAKRVGKLRKDYELPQIYRNNLPESYVPILAKYKAKGLYQPFPFGTDLNTNEIKIGKALKGLKADSAHKPKMIGHILKGLTLKPKPRDMELLERMQLHAPSNFKERLYRGLLLVKFREFGY